jgi:hypothetical protein
VPESGPLGSVRGAPSNRRSYRDIRRDGRRSTTALPDLILFLEGVAVITEDATIAMLTSPGEPLSRKSALTTSLRSQLPASILVIIGGSRSHVLGFRGLNHRKNTSPSARAGRECTTPQFPCACGLLAPSVPATHHRPPECTTFSRLPSVGKPSWKNARSFRAIQRQSVCQDPSIPRSTRHGQ